MCARAFNVIIYGRGGLAGRLRDVLFWTQGKGVAILDPEDQIEISRRRAAFLAQTAKSNATFAGFVTFPAAYGSGPRSELSIVNTSGQRFQRRRGHSAMALGPGGRRRKGGNPA